MDFGDCCSERGMYEDPDERDCKHKQNAAKWSGKSVKGTGRAVYVLTLESWDHSVNYRGGPDTIVIGTFDSKDAAVAKATSYETAYGTFDSAVKSIFYDDYIDKRDIPPDNGVLMQIGSKHSGEGDYESFIIKKMDIEGICIIEGKEKKSTNQQPKAKASKRPRVDSDDDLRDESDGDFCEVGC